MRSLSLVVSIALAAVVSVACAACASGSYVPADRPTGDDAGETNGRRFDFVSNKPAEDEWQIRVTGSSMWVSYARDAKSDKLGSIRLTEAETNKLWDLIDAVNIPGRKQGTKDEDVGYVSLQLKEPAVGGEPSARYMRYMSRATENKQLIALATYLQDLTEKYKKERPSF
ncbi:MAG: hypothetical protein H7138_03740 [Myxococcales bacterium]|nr:hypothetical protein [Myxococcales bacterium]